MRLPCALPTDYVYAVDWCLIDDVPYLAVAGCPDESGNSLWIYRYDDTYGMVFVAASKAFKGTVYSAKWQDNQCTLPDGIRNLALGGEAIDGNNIIIEQFNAQAQQVYQLSATSFGATVFTLDWCKGKNQPLQSNDVFLLAGGKAASDCQGVANIRIYKVGCDWIIHEQAAAYYEGGTTRSVKWCCQQDQFCKQLMYFLLGGDPTEKGENLFVYYFNPACSQIKPFISHNQPLKVFAVDWLPSCLCTHLIAGSGCLRDVCTPDISVYNIDRALVPDLGIVSQKHFDDNITSLATTKVNDITYILAGSESNHWSPSGNDPLCPMTIYSRELALYKGIFCATTTSTTTCKPVSACERHLRNSI